MEPIDTTESDNQQFESRRLEVFQSKPDFNPYPHKFNVTMSFEEYINKYSHVETGSRHHELVECVAGRIQEKRNSGKKLFFYTVKFNGFTLQYLADIKEYENQDKFAEINDLIHRGDIVGVRGFVGKSLKGELSIYPLELVLLTPCYKAIQKEYIGVTNMDIRIRNRHLDMIVNPKTIQTFKTRSRVISELRKFLDSKNFIELQTPVLSDHAGGASAKPFVTHHNALDQKMYLRIATELHLKRLVIGGLERVYEIGPQFRNESIDSSHLPEFYSVEAYGAYLDYRDWMNWTEEFLFGLIMRIHGQPQIPYLPANKDTELIIDFTPPYRKIDIMTELTNRLEVNFPKDLSTEEARLFLDQLCKDNNVDCSPPRTASRLLDKLIGHYIEPQCVNPTFLMNHPLIMSPLAKQHRDFPHLTERFELFICGMELANSYTELNNHLTQIERFSYQAKERVQGDEEAQGIDESFVDALRYGLPPCGGFGLGIERLVMFMTNCNSIRDVIPFPATHNNDQ